MSFSAPRRFLAGLALDDDGQDLVEYALLATFVALVVIAGAALLGTGLNNWLNALSAAIDSAAGALGP